MGENKNKILMRDNDTLMWIGKENAYFQTSLLGMIYTLFVQNKFSFISVILSTVH